MLENRHLSMPMRERHVPKTGNKPGVTKGKQWIRLKQNSLELLGYTGYFVAEI